jgi:glutamate carboxypeptidase
LAHKIIGLESINGRIPGVRVNVGTAQGGLGPATIPPEASALIDVRWEDQVVREDLVRRMEEVVNEEHLPGCRSQLKIINERSTWPLTEGTQRLAEMIKRVSANLGRPIEQEHRIGTSDSNFFGCAGVPTVDGLGPVCRGYHTSEEFVYIQSITERTTLLAHTLLAMREGLG